ncbi:MAG TPA: hypothetical protein VMM79_02180 [Longimicrobiales bacterium]|nr:hypothetical protein [Longimicrobiales bacterium]
MKAIENSPARHLASGPVFVRITVDYLGEAVVPSHITYALFRRAADGALLPLDGRIDRTGGRLGALGANGLDKRSGHGPDHPRQEVAGRYEHARSRAGGGPLRRGTRSRARRAASRREK